MPNSLSRTDLPDTLLVRDPQIDADELTQQIRINMAERTKLPPLPAALGTARLAADRQTILKSVKDLQERIRDYGLVETHRAGWKARLELFVKKSIRKLFQRHILQQHRVHLKLVTVLNQLSHYLEEQDRCMRACLDLAGRQCEESALALRAEMPGPEETCCSAAANRSVFSEAT